jgi:rubredoxin
VQVTIRNNPEEILVQTISLTTNRKSPLNVFLFFCDNCGYQIRQVQGAVARIFPGLEPSNEIPTISKCPQCGEKYVFQTKKFLKDDRTHVTLASKNNKISTFHCSICRVPLLQFTNTSLVVLPEYHVMKVPFPLNCINSTCSQKYNIDDVI